MADRGGPRDPIEKEPSCSRTTAAEAKKDSDDKGKAPKRGKRSAEGRSSENKEKAIPGSSSAFPVQSRLSPSEGACSDDILSLLREIQTKQTQQGERLDTLSSTVNMWSQDYDPDEDYQSYLPLEDVECVEPATKVQRTETAVPELGDSDQQIDSCFKRMLTRYQHDEKVDKNVDDALATMINAMFMDGVSQEKFDELCKDITRPVNCEALAKCKVNQLIWDIMTPGVRDFDRKLQVCQGALVKSAAVFTKLVDSLSQKEDPSLQQLVDDSMDGLALLGHTNRLINMRRRELIKPDLGRDYSHLVSSSVPVTSFLFGDDVSKEVTNISNVNRVASRIAATGQVRGYNRGRTRGRGFFHRGRGGRGRGRFVNANPPYTGSSSQFKPVPKNVKPSTSAHK